MVDSIVVFLLLLFTSVEIVSTESLSLEPSYPTFRPPHVSSVTVSKDGRGNFTTINEALSAVPERTSSSKGYFLIYVLAGVYEEYVSIDQGKTYLMMIGDGINKTIITGNHSTGDGWGTFYSATFGNILEHTYNAKNDIFFLNQREYCECMQLWTRDRFVAVNITIRNTAGPEKYQAVAVRNTANMSVFYSCSLEGYQDTLYAHSNIQFYRECDIYGTVDFIFGNSAAVFQNCNIYVRKPMKGQFNVITAQGREWDYDHTGFSIHNCTIRAAEDLAGAATYLGRPWKPLSKTVYMESFMDNIIHEAGWHVWDSDKDSDLNTLYFAEYKNYGPGSNTSHRVTWKGFHVIESSIAAGFTVSKFLSGDSRLPLTGVPYTGHLVNA